ncbi:hypothetical protein ARMSODRAFT_962960 [Armillaria solidipes]|uniref:Uncharacterized protein n=1 Tax=Armillaria solidipes TaxID=1076256 RepID=A0A2H3BGE9_9AGAR|nr:hypothetical protein ARMSODRAFT_962960 [Armillaria solidipes]
MSSNEKRCPVHIQKPNRFVYGVIEPAKFTKAIVDWVEVISQDHRALNLRALQSCHVTRIEHYRSGQGTICDELVVIHIRSGDDDQVRARQADYRVMVLKHFKEGSSSTTERIIHSMQEPTASDLINSDLVSFGAYLNDACDDFDSKYKLVQRFAVPPGKMDVIHCASLATSITQSGKNYSTLHHMCHWFAALFFHTARSLCMWDDSDGCIIEHGPLYADRGKVALVRLVDDNCVLLPGGAVSLDLILGQLRDGMVKEGITQELVTTFEATLRSDIEAMDDHPELKKAPVRQMLHISQSAATTVRARMVEADTDAEREYRLAERERRLEERERKVEELEREREQRLAQATRGQAA